MAVTSVDQIAGTESRQDEMYRRYYKKVFVVQTDDRRDGGLMVRSAAGVPSIGSVYTNGVSGDAWYEIDAGAFCNAVTAVQTSAGANPNSSQWTVTAEYGPIDSAALGGDPVLWPIRLQWGSQKFERALVQDADGKAITNSAGDPFQEAVNVDDTRSILFIKRNELVSTFPPLLASQYKDTLNQGTWNGSDEGTVKCADITTSDPLYDSLDNVWYYEVTYVFEYCSLNSYLSGVKWTKQLLDQGFAVLSGGSLQTVLDDNGQKRTDPVLLNGSGGRLASGGTPVFLTYKGYPIIDWSGLNIDFSTRLGA